MPDRVWCTLPDGSQKLLSSDCYYASSAYKSARDDAIRNQRDEYRRFASGQSNTVRNVNWGNQFRNLPRP